MMKYERLTKKGGLDFSDKSLCLADEWGYSHIYNRLAELEDKIEQGTLKELPENAVVLTREEYNYLINDCKRWENLAVEKVDEINKTRKETVDKFAEKIYYKANAYGDYDTDGNHIVIYELTQEKIDEIAKEITEGK